MAVDADLGVEVGGGVEVLRKDPVLVDDAQQRFSRVDQVGSVDLDPHEQELQCIRISGTHPDPGGRLVVWSLPDVEALDDVVGAELENVVEQLGQTPRVEDVTVDLDCFADGHRALLARA